MMSVDRDDGMRDTLPEMVVYDTVSGAEVLTDFFSSVGRILARRD